MIIRKQRRGVSWPLLFLLLISALSAGAATIPGVSHPEIAFLTDFGLADDSVAICHQIIYNISPGVRILDITHQVPPSSIIDGARYLADMNVYVPKGTIFVAVVDPGVGTSHRAIVARSRRGNYYVLPDNGLLTFVQDNDGIDGVRLIANPKWILQDALSSSFHGRDIYAPVAAHLAKGENWIEVGPALAEERLMRLNVPQPTMTDGSLHGTVIGRDGPMGNLITNVNRDVFAKLGYKVGDRLSVTLGNSSVEFSYARTLEESAKGSPIAFMDSRGRLSFALNQASAVEDYSLKPPAEFTIPQRK